MSEVEVYKEGGLESLESVIGLRLQGLNPTQISKRLDIPRRDVINLIDRWRADIANDTQTRDVARDALNTMVRHYDNLIAETYKVIEDLKNEVFTHQISAQINASLKNISDFESKRVDALQKAGMMDNSDLGDELAKMEEDKEMIINILRNELCEKCRPNVMRKIGEMSGRVEVVVVHE